jgi:hypothetical protein
MKITGTDDQKLTSIISGKVLPLEGIIAYQNISWFEAYAAPCTDPVYAHLFDLDNDGALNKIIASKEVTSNARFSFDNAGIDLNPNVAYVIRVSGCQGVYYRPVTDLNDDQDVSYASTLLGLAAYTNTENKLHEIERAVIEKMITRMAGASLINAYQKFDSETELSSFFLAAFGSHHSVLRNALPQILNLEVNPFLNEGMASQFVVNAAHFDPGYDIVYKWKLDGVLKSSATTFSYTPGKNEQGTKTLALYLGKDDGFGEIDLSKPYYFKSFLLKVANTFPSTPPTLSITSSTTTTRDITLMLDTGLVMANCESFTDLALTEQTSAVPSSGQFTINCSTAVSQNLNYSLASAGGGPKVLRLWARDAAGNISNSPSTLTVTLDTSPAVTVISDAYISGSSIEFTVDDCTDKTHVLVNSGDTPLEESSSWVSCDTTITYSHTISDSDGLKTYTVWSKDTSGNVSDSGTTISTTRDTTAPTLSSFVLASGATSVVTPFISVSLSASDVNPMSFRISEDSSFSGVTWQSYTSTSSFALSSAAGPKTVYLEIKDSLDNTTSAQRSINLELGVAPVVQVVSPASGFYSENDSFTLTWSCSTSSGNLAAVPISKIEYTINDGTSFEDITANFSLPKRSNPTESEDWSIPAALDNVPFRIQISCESEAGVVSKILSPYYNTSGWSIYAGAPWDGNTEIAALNANASGGSTITADANFNLYYTRGHAIMKLNNQTSFITTYLGSITSSGTDLNPDGPITSNMLLSSPVIQGASLDFRYLYLRSAVTTDQVRIYRIDTQTDSIELWNTINNPLNSNFFVTKGRWLIFTTRSAPTWSAHIKRVNLNTKDAPLEVIAGSGGDCGTISANGTDALSSQMPRATNGICYFGTGSSSLFANADASKIWFSPVSTNGFRLDWDSTNNKYIIGDNNITRRPGTNCVPNESDANVYCGAARSRNVCGVNPDSGSMAMGCKTFAFAGNDSSGNARIGMAPEDVYVHYTLNSIMRLKWSTGTFTSVAGQPFSTFGNGTNLSLVAFHNPTDMHYSPISKHLMVRNSSGHLRVIDFNTNPRTISTSFYSFYTHVNGFFSLSYDGTKLSSYWTHGGCGSPAVFDKYTYNSSTQVITGTLGNMQYLGSCNKTYGHPVPDNTPKASTFFDNIASPHQSHLAHSNGNFYAAFQNSNGSEVYIYKSDGTTITHLAGQPGAGGYDPTDHTNSARDALLKNVWSIQELSSGDILFWDDHRLRKITLTTESADPKILDLIDYRTVTGYTTTARMSHSIYDESTGNTYFIKDSGIYKIESGAQTRYTFTGTTVGHGNRLALTPDGLLILDKVKARILRVEP